MNGSMFYFLNAVFTCARAMIPAIARPAAIKTGAFFNTLPMPEAAPDALEKKSSTPEKKPLSSLTFILFSSQSLG